MHPFSEKVFGRNALIALARYEGEDPVLYLSFLRGWKGGRGGRPAEVL